MANPLVPVLMLFSCVHSVTPQSQPVPLEFVGAYSLQQEAGEGDPLMNGAGNGAQRHLADQGGSSRCQASVGKLVLLGHRGINSPQGCTPLTDWFLFDPATRVV